MTYCQIVSQWSMSTPVSSCSLMQTKKPSQPTFSLSSEMQVVDRFQSLQRWATVPLQRGYHSKKCRKCHFAILSVFDIWGIIIVWPGRPLGGMPEWLLGQMEHGFVEPRWITSDRLADSVDWHTCSMCCHLLPNSPSLSACFLQLLTHSPLFCLTKIHVCPDTENNTERFP